MTDPKYTVRRISIGYETYDVNHRAGAWPNLVQIIEDIIKPVEPRGWLSAQQGYMNLQPRVLVETHGQPMRQTKAAASYLQGFFDYLFPGGGSADLSAHRPKIEVFHARPHADWSDFLRALGRCKDAQLAVDKSADMDPNVKCSWTKDEWIDEVTFALYYPPREGDVAGRAWPDNIEPCNAIVTATVAWMCLPLT